MGMQGDVFRGKLYAEKGFRTWAVGCDQIENRGLFTNKLASFGSFKTYDFWYIDRSVTYF